MVLCEEAGVEKPLAVRLNHPLVCLLPFWSHWLQGRETMSSHCFNVAGCSELRGI